MQRLATTAWILVAAVLVAGCFEGKADLTLNPDGTGKIVGEMTFQARPPWTGRTRQSRSSRPDPSAPTPSSAPEIQTVTPEEQMKEIVSSILSRSRGIEVWKDVSFERLADDRIRFQGTGYFRDLSDVRLWPDESDSRFGFGPEGDGVMALVANPGAGRRTSRSGRTYSAEAMAKRMKEERLAYRRTKGQLALDMAGFRFDLAFHVPGVPSEVRGLQQRGGALTLGLQGMEVLRALDALVADNAFLAELIAAGGSLQGERTVNQAINRELFGGKGELWARMKGPFRERFRYEAEVEAAKTAFPEMIEKLGLEKVRIPRSPGRSSRSSSRGKTPDDAPKPPDDDKADKRVPRVPLPRKLPTIPAPILPF